MNLKEHWEGVYKIKSDHEVSWYRDHLETSLRLIRATGVGKDASIIDVGGGSSTLVDDLLDDGFIDLTVLDISQSALKRSKDRLGRRAESVDWVETDITDADLPSDRFDVWHDRAVFHFLTDPQARRRYVDIVTRSLKKGGHIIIASFGVEGPQKCSGLDVVRYSPEAMHDAFGPGFKLVKSVSEVHETPFKTTQEFVYCYCRKT